jgi:hypothetical protein
MTVKAGREDEFLRVAKEGMATTRAEDRGCISYVFYRQSDNRRQFVLYEQWPDADALNAHVARLQRVYGPPNDHEPHPPNHHRRRLPKAFLDFFEKTEAVRYDSLE